MSDFTYSESGEFVCIFPETPEAVEEWNREIAPKTHGTGKVLASDWPEVKSQLQEAGYSVAPSPPVTETNEELLAALS